MKRVDGLFVFPKPERINSGTSGFGYFSFPLCPAINITQQTFRTFKDGGQGVAV